MKAIVMYSGGADSTLALLLAIEKYGTDAVRAVYVDFIGQSTRENTQFVVSTAHSLGVAIECFIVTVDDAGKGPEGNARLKFKAVLSWVTNDYPSAEIWMGHNKDDHAETVLIQLFRGAGAGTRGMMDQRQGNIFRPVLKLTREEIRDECERRGVSFYDDPMNMDLTLTRVFFREKIIPLLKEHYGKGAYTRIDMIAKKFNKEQPHVRR